MTRRVVQSVMCASTPPLPCHVFSYTWLAAGPKSHAPLFIVIVAAARPRAKLTRHMRFGETRKLHTRRGVRVERCVGGILRSVFVCFWRAQKFKSQLMFSWHFSKMTRNRERVEEADIFSWLAVLRRREKGKRRVTRVVLDKKRPESLCKVLLLLCAEVDIYTRHTAHSVEFVAKSRVCADTACCKRRYALCMAETRIILLNSPAAPFIYIADKVTTRVHIIIRKRQVSWNRSKTDYAQRHSSSRVRLSV